MNKWQEYFISTYYNGKKPRDKMGKTEFELLGKVKETVTVHFPNETKTFSSRGKAASREAKLQKITFILAIVIAVLAIALPVIQLFK